MPRLVLLLLLATLNCAVHAAGDTLPAEIIRVPESVKTLFIAETSTAKFHRFDRTADSIMYSGSFYMSIGEQGAGKQEKGDKRTPLGVYFVTEQLDTSRLHEKYGITAFPLDYPNAWDRRAGRDGDGIWVHGVDRRGGQRPVRDTDGCIALPNADLETLMPRFESNVTPVLVTRSAMWANSGDRDRLRQELESRVAAWVAGKSDRDWYAFLSLYDEDFKRWDMNKQEWSALQLENALAGEAAELSVADLLLLRYPEEPGVYLSRFTLQTDVDGQVRQSKTRLYWRRAASGELKIIAEDNG